MPTYAYECAACGHGLEEFQTMTAKPIRRCPACKALKLKRLIGPGAGFIFKGTGFYITDYKSKKSNDEGRRREGGDPSTDAPVKTTDSKTTDSKTTDSKSTDSKGADAKSADAKSTEARGTDAKAAEPKPPVTPKSDAKKRQTDKER